jgi:hypothetical protein
MRFLLIVDWYVPINLMRKDQGLSKDIELTRSL